ncbi:MAG: M12 family metallo-peptidase [Chloroflexota bacterium]
METRFRKNVFMIVAVILLFALVAMMSSSTVWASTVMQAGEPENGLFAQSRSRANALALEPAASRARLVDINFTALDNAPVAFSPASEEITLNLFKDTVFVAQRDRIEKNRSGSTTWIGFFDAPAGRGQAILVFRDDIVTAHINAPDGEYSVYPLSSNAMTHMVMQLKPDAIEPSEHVTPFGFDIPMPTNPQGLPTMEASAVSDDGSVIDVLVVYSDDVTASLGVPATESLIDLYMSYTNQAYINSNISQRVDLVYTGELTYNDTGQSNALGHARIDGDGQLDDIHTLRNTYHADLSYVLVNYPGAGSCGGVAYLQNVQAGFPTWFDTWAFSAQQACSFGASIFAHELGHNMGSNHDWYVDAPTSFPYSYAHGFVDRTNQFLTIMSYTNHCSAAPAVSCTKIPHFANPNVNYNGNPTGVASGTSTACTQFNVGNPLCDADNQLTFTMSDSVIAAFRQSQITWLGNNTDWNDTSNWLIQEGPSGSLTPVNRVPRSIDNVYIPASPTGGSNFPTISSGTVNARDVTIETGATLNMTGGTLNVYGIWEEQGTGSFNGTGGTVVFMGSLYTQGVTSNPAAALQNAPSIQQASLMSTSTFHNVQIGNGGTTEVSLSSNMDINGNLTIKNGATFKPNDKTVKVAGNWTDETVSGFIPESSTVILDGTTQTVDKTITSSTLIDEGFDAYTTCCSGSLPTGWLTEAGSYFQGPLIGGEPSASRWRFQTDGYLITAGVSLVPDTVYTLEYKVATRQNFWTGNDGVLSAQTVSVLLGTGQASGSLTTVLSAPTVETATSYQTRTINNITVATAGTYYIGFRAQQSGDDYTSFDDIKLTGTGGITFNNLTVASGVSTINDDLTVNGNLTVDASATLDFGANDPTVEGTVTNNGTLKQTKDVPNGDTTNFLEIYNKAGDVPSKYYGTRITPTSTGLGSTTVEIGGHQECTTNTSDPILDRCYDISPTNHNSATIRYYYTSGELNGQTWDSLKLWDWNSGAWVELASGTDTYGGGCGTTLGCWGEWDGIATYSPMVLGTTTAPTGSPAGTCSAPTLSGEAIARDVSGDNAVSWTATANSIGIWYKADDPYFTIAGTCASPGAGLSCLTDANNMSPSDAGALPNSTTSNNYYFLVQANNSCGSNTTGTQRLGDFSFEITPGTP